MSDQLTLDVDQAGELKAAFRRTRGSNGERWDNEAIKALSTGALLGNILDVINGLSLIEPKKENTSHMGNATIIRVDRTNFVRYPGSMKKLLWPDSANLGPAEYDIKDIDQWCHEKQFEGATSGQVIFEFVNKYDEPQNHFELNDLLVIKKKGSDFFREHFGCKKIFAWRSAIEREFTSIRKERVQVQEVPFLSLSRNGRGRILNLEWRRLSDLWDVNCPALRFSK